MKNKLLLFSLCLAVALSGCSKKSDDEKKQYTPVVNEDNYDEYYKLFYTSDRTSTDDINAMIEVALMTPLDEPLFSEYGIDIYSDEMIKLIGMTDGTYEEKGPYMICEIGKGSQKTTWNINRNDLAEGGYPAEHYLEPIDESRILKCIPGFFKKGDSFQYKMVKMKETYTGVSDNDHYDYYLFFSNSADYYPEIVAGNIIEDYVVVDYTRLPIYILCVDDSKPLEDICEYKASSSFSSIISNDVFSTASRLIKDQDICFLIKGNASIGYNVKADKKSDSADVIQTILNIEPLNGTTTSNLLGYFQNYIDLDKSCLDRGDLFRFASKGSASSDTLPLIEINDMNDIEEMQSKYEPLSTVNHILTDSEIRFIHYDRAISYPRNEYLYITTSDGRSIRLDSIENDDLF